jgi:hypothetical protein
MTSKELKNAIAELADDEDQIFIRFRIEAASNNKVTNTVAELCAAKSVDNVIYIRTLLSEEF